MQALPTELPGVLILEPKVFGDERGFFMESFNAREFAKLTGCTKAFVQDNHSRSARHVLRGLHYQLAPMAQDKLVRVVAGEILDVAVDVLRGSPTFGRCATVRLSADNKRQMWIPAGHAHGFLALSEAAEVQYKVTQYHSPQHERSIRWDDPALGISWDVAEPVLSGKDRAAPLLAGAELDARQ
ncbi:MAG TPA: dTDP-4-dehydrorhamnose 3,5-epimerase [Verrucomicrobiae bacterium]|nr:dTDP-4-dehydrorhamnose 3,5-epimerase [Verrucomicrobiae bacterium]